jgi:uncharacterized protein (TIGR02996 family)
MLVARFKRWVGRRPADEAPRGEDDTDTVSPSSEVAHLGDALRALEARGRALPVGAVAALGLALIDGLEAAPATHLRGTNPDDVLVTRQATVRVLSRKRRREGGRFGYFSPEFARGEAVREATDVYAVCALLFGAASGRPPVQVEGDFATLEAVVAGRRASLEAVRPALPAPFVEVIHRGLSRAPMARFPTLDALAQALRPFADGGRTALVTMLFDEVGVAAPPAAPLDDADEARMLAAIARGDDSARVVYADLLEERGLADCARWLRLELEVRAAPAEQRPPLVAELAALRPRVGQEFIASVGRAPLEGCPVVFGFQCPMTWGQLRPTRDARVRYCEGCASTVTYFDDLDEARAAADSGACVALDVSIERTPGDLFPSQGMVLGRLA